MPSRIRRVMGSNFKIEKKPLCCNLRADGMKRSKEAFITNRVHSRVDSDLSYKHWAIRHW